VVPGFAEIKAGLGGLPGVVRSRVNKFLTPAFVLGPDSPQGLGYLQANLRCGGCGPFVAITFAFVLIAFSCDADSSSIGR